MIESFAVAKETGQKENPLTPTFFRLWEKKSPFIENERLGMLSLLLLSALLLIVRAKDYWGERQTLDIKFKAFFLSKLEIARARQLEMNESHSHRCVFLYLSQLLYKTFICARLCVWKIINCLVHGPKMIKSNKKVYTVSLRFENESNLTRHRISLLLVTNITLQYVLKQETNT